MRRRAGPLRGVGILTLQGFGGSSPIRMYDENQIAGKREGGGGAGSILVSHDIPGLVR